MRGRRSASVDRASEGVITCGSVAIGSDITGGVVEPRSYSHSAIEK